MAKQIYWGWQGMGGGMGGWADVRLFLLDSGPKIPLSEKRLKEECHEIFDFFLKLKTCLIL